MQSTETSSVAQAESVAPVVRMETCGMCGQLRFQSDCVIRSVHFYMRTYQTHFCKDKGCADRYFRLHPKRQFSSRKKRW